ncbi:hypothetical protein [Bradyrhizobium sp. JR3.5]
MISVTHDHNDALAISDRGCGDARKPDTIGFCAAGHPSQTADLFVAILVNR